MAKKDSLRLPDEDTVDQRVLAAAMALYKHANPGGRWARSDKKHFWLADAQRAIDAADEVDPLRATGDRGEVAHR
ncbi:hypothetical protein [Telmatospirillum siberiense]|uniref:Uncharacterized protein n=1 Tax=Telmatospirillum siberiense TaxID=382514 RepID=A0A2N3PRS6_9PROT|nr:hypothetical protein [Telmatospirillum siberiense]PKU23106.1 hypothetical protein CWS72_17895 [Telmatospirillum siberiense]